jgi:hypothetical protein
VTLENGAALIGDGGPVGRERVGPENADGAGPEVVVPAAEGTPDAGAGGGASASSFVSVGGPIEPLTSTVPVSVGPLFTPFGRPGGGAVGGFVRGATSGAGLAPMVGVSPVTRPARAGGGGGTDVAPLRVLVAGAITALAPVTRPARPDDAGGADVGPERAPLGTPLDGALAVPLAGAFGTPLDVRPDAAPASGFDGAAVVARDAPSSSVSSSVPLGGSSQPADSCATRARVSSAAGGFVAGAVRFGPDAPLAGGARFGPEVPLVGAGESGVSHPEARSATRAFVSSPIRRRLRSSSGGGATQPPYHTPVLVENRRQVPIPLTHPGNFVDML